ncbi:MAG: metal ABC transporter substrate-binding protein [Actinobacteria bacterium]|nr:metal ABC transporter substrate-binding protein [Actinomycetota bacterium]
MFVSRLRRMTALPALVALTGAFAGGLAGCGDPATGSGGGRTQVVVGFYAAQYLAERVGGDRVSVTNLTAPGVEPHDLELTARQVVRLAKADLVITVPGFQPAVDEGIVAAQARRVLDLAPVVGVDLAGGESHDAQPHAEDGHAAAGHAHETAADLGHDPHFWLDPHLMADASAAVAAQLSAADPGGTGLYEANSAALQADLETLEAEINSRLHDCRQQDLVTSHAAYGRLAAITGFVPHPLALNPEAEPSPAQLAEITDLVHNEGIATIYVEPLANRRVAEVVAAETGARTAALDPIEGGGAIDSPQDYLGLMRANVATLAAGQECLA